MKTAWILKTKTNNNKKAKNSSDNIKRNMKNRRQEEQILASVSTMMEASLKKIKCL